MATDEEVIGQFISLYDDLKKEDEFPARKPLLAHYTSLEALESIAATNELWFSNPLLMNDLDEVRFGVVGGMEALRRCDGIRKALGSDSRFQLFDAALGHYYSEFNTKHLFDTYVFCMSEHDPKNTDGVLSMWRGYGGSGNGVAIIFDAGKLNVAEGSTPIILSRVHYGTAAERQKWLTEICEKAADLIAKATLSDDKIYLAANAIFERIQLFALFSKHVGFGEELEWRAVYRPSADRDTKYAEMFSYTVGTSGVEPKFKMKVRPIAGLTSADLSLEKLITGIILGPTTSSVLAQMSVRRMLALTKHPELANLVTASSIPLRPKQR